MKQWTVCTACGRHSPYGCRTCPPPPRRVWTLTTNRYCWWAAAGWTALIVGVISGQWAWIS